MNPQMLFDHFERLADAPEAIAKLRAMILQLAVQGKLVPQDPDDEPASVLLEKIAAEKERLIKEGKIRKTEPLPPIGPDELLYDLPEGWEWVRLGNVTTYGELERVERWEVGPDVWSLELEDIEKITSRLLVRVIHADREIRSTRNKFQKGDVLYGKLRPYLDKVLVADSSGICTTEIIPFNGYGKVDAFYLRLALKSPGFVSYATNSTHGMNLPRLATERARLALLALPSLPEQKRIVAKVDQLMALCDELEERKKRRNEAWVNLNAACLHELTSPETQKSRKAWNRIQSQFDVLYDTPANVIALRKSILQLAVMGRLAPQDPSDEPAPVLLEKIAEEKERLIEEGKIKKGKPLPPIRPDEVPYEVPEGWEWVRLGEVVSQLGDGIHGTPVYDQSGEFFFINGNNLSDGAIEIKEDTKRVSFIEYQKYKKELNERTVFVSINGTIGKVAFYNCEKVILGKSTCYFNLFTPVTKHYIKTLIDSSYFMDYALESATGSTIKNVSLKAMREFCVPLSPLPEQERIVAKVDSLMALCDQLEVQLAQSQRDCDALLSAIANQISTASQ